MLFEMCSRWLKDWKTHRVKLIWLKFLYVKIILYLPFHTERLSIPTGDESSSTWVHFEQQPTRGKILWTILTSSLRGWERSCCGNLRKISAEWVLRCWTFGCDKLTIQVGYEVSSFHPTQQVFSSTWIRYY